MKSLFLASSFRIPRVLGVVLATALAAACSSTGAHEPPAWSTDAGNAPDAGSPMHIPPPDAGGGDAAGFDAGGPDSGVDRDECFAEVPVFASANRSRASFQPHAILAHEGGWIAIFSWADGTPESFGSSVAMIDRDGRLVSTRPFGLARTWRHTVVGRFLVSWGTWGFHTIRVHEIDDDELIEVADPLPSGHVAHIESLAVDSDDTVRVLSTETTTTTHLRYAELVLDEDGRFRARSGALPNLEPLVAASRLYGGLPAPTYLDDVLWFAYPTHEDPFNVDGQAWHVVKVRLDVNRSETFDVTWRIESESRWDNGPVSAFGVLPALDAVVAGRWAERPDGTLSPEVVAERISSSTSVRIARLDRDSDSTDRSLGPVHVTVRDSTLAVGSAGYFRAFNLPSFEERESVPLTMSGLVAPRTDEVAELGSVRSAPTDEAPEGRLLGLVRCHRLGGVDARR